MLNSLKSPLLLSAMLSAALGLTACSSPSSEGSDTASADSAATDTAADKLDTKFLTIATGGALYWKDFNRLSRDAGFLDVCLV